MTSNKDSSLRGRNDIQTSVEPQGNATEEALGDNNARQGNLYEQTEGTPVSTSSKTGGRLGGKTLRKKKLYKNINHTFQKKERKRRTN